MWRLEPAEPTADQAFHDEPVFLDIAVGVGIRVLRQIDPDVALSGENPAIARLLLTRPSCIAIARAASEGMHPTVPAAFRGRPIAALDGAETIPRDFPSYRAFRSPASPLLMMGVAVRFRGLELGGVITTCRQTDILRHGHRPPSGVVALGPGR